MQIKQFAFFQFQMTFKSVFYLKNIKKQLGFFMILCVDVKNKKIMALWVKIYFLYIFYSKLQ